MSTIRSRMKAAGALGAVAVVVCSLAAARPAPQGAPPGAQKAPAVPPGALPPVPAVPRSDGTYRDLQGNVLTPPAVMAGTRFEPCPPSLAKHLGLDASQCSVLDHVKPELPAALAGLEAHDIIVAVNGSTNASPEAIRTVIRAMKPGDVLHLTAQRAGKLIRAEVTMVPWEASKAVRPLSHDSVKPLPSLQSVAPPPPTAAQVAQLQARVEALERQVAALAKQVSAASKQP